MAIVLAAACGSTAQPTTSQPTTSASRAPSAPPGTTAAARGTYPVELVTPAGSTVIPALPVRIVSLSPTATEDLFAIGAGAQVVATDSYSDYPPGAPRTKLDALNPNVEAVANYRPDLVVDAGEPAHFSSQLAQLKIPSLDEPAATDLAQAYGQIEQLGRATGHVAAATALVGTMKVKIAELEAEVHKSSPPLTYYYELSPDYYSVTSGTFVGQLFGLLGLHDIADARGVAAAGGYPQLSSESIIASRPDLVLLADTICCAQTARTVRARPGWSTIPAVAAGHIVALNDDIASRWGPRIVTLLADIVTAVKRVQARG